MLASPPRLKPPASGTVNKNPLQAELAELVASNDEGGPGYYNGAEVSGTVKTTRCPPQGNFPTNQSPFK